MARAPSTGYYFEPLTERLALVLEGAAFPSGDAWAWVGDPLEVPAEVALLEVATRWPGVDPEALEIEYETNYQRAVEEIDRLRGEEARRGGYSGELDFDVRALLAQAEELQAQATLMLAPPAKEPATSETVGEAIARAALSTSKKS
jgi:hypothetical protein